VAWDEVKYDTKKEKPNANQQEPPANKQVQLQPRQQDRQLRQQQPGEGDYSHMHSKLKAFFEPIIKKFGGRLRIGEIMFAAGVQWKDMPKLAPDKMTGRDNQCWDYTCGTCKFGKFCERSAFHILLVKDMPDKFVEDTIKTLMPGVKKMGAENYDRREYQQNS
jgi:hypothetical protein